MGVKGLGGETAGMKSLELKHLELNSHVAGTHTCSEVQTVPMFMPKESPERTTLILLLLKPSSKVLELKVCIVSCLFTFPVAKFCQILKKHLGKELCPGQDLNPGPLAYEASVLPFCHGHFIVNLLKVEKLFQFCLLCR